MRGIHLFPSKITVCCKGWFQKNIEENPTYRDAHSFHFTSMGLLPDTYNCGLCMRRGCRERFPCHRPQRNPSLAIPTCIMARVTHVPWCTLGSPTRGGGKNVPGTPGACATRNFTYLVRGPCVANARNTLVTANLRPFSISDVVINIGIVSFAL